MLLRQLQLLRFDAPAAGGLPVGDSSIMPGGAEKRPPSAIDASQGRARARAPELAQGQSVGSCVQARSLVPSARLFHSSEEEVLRTAQLTGLKRLRHTHRSPCVMENPFPDEFGARFAIVIRQGAVVAVSWKSWKRIFLGFVSS